MYVDKEKYLNCIILFLLIRFKKLLEVAKQTLGFKDVKIAFACARMYSQIVTFMDWYSFTCCLCCARVSRYASLDHIVALNILLHVTDTKMPKKSRLLIFDLLLILFH
jgi:hypothetical protein